MAPPLTPQGVLDLPGYDVRSTVLASWDAFLALAEVLETLGTAAAGTPLKPDVFNAGVVNAHTDASDAEVLAALRSSREAVAQVLQTPDPDRDRGLVASAAGPLPLLTIIHGGCYELALHALDIAAAADRPCDPLLLRNGIVALTDTTGGLAARSGAEATVGIVADESAWGFSAHPDGTWTTSEIVGEPHGPRVAGGAVDLLEASSGRAEPVRLVATRRLKVSHPAGLATLAPILGDIPGIPGGKGLALAAKSLGRIGSLLSRRG